MSADPARRAVILAHMHDTQTFLASGKAPCDRIRDEEAAATRPRGTPQRTGRRIRPLGIEEVKALRPEGSWLLAVLLGPGDTLAPVAAWASRLAPADQRRIRVFHHPDVDLPVALGPWPEATLGAVSVDLAPNQVVLHHALGQYINERIWLDHGPGRA
ncbi:MAG: hypothetical protein HYT80_08195 [Euryarchaeota archaeon]|nr:hypothetical protein [Euryarchaeota archaeon]